MAFFTKDDCIAQRSPGRLIRRIDKLVAALLEERLGDFALTYPQWATLKLVDDGVVGTAGELARDLRHTTGATTRLIDVLEERGLLVRDRGGPDRRVVRLRVTDEGARQLARIMPTITDLWNELLADFDRAEAEAMLASLNKLAGVLERISATRRRPFTEAAE